ncbi:MAG: hypothetical protein WCC98_04180 [Candidatus Acidiferrales bacterium]
MKRGRNVKVAAEAEVDAATAAGAEAAVVVVADTVAEAEVADAAAMAVEAEAADDATGNAQLFAISDIIALSYRKFSKLKSWD